MADLVMAVSFGTPDSLLSPHGPPMTAMTVLPLSLVPTFIVPLLLIFHVICIAQARAWKAYYDYTRQTSRPVRNLVTVGVYSQRRKPRYSIRIQNERRRATDLRNTDATTTR